MDEVSKAINDLADTLYNTPLVIEFRKAQKLVHSDNYLMETEAKLKDLQKRIVLNVMDKQMHATLKSEYDSLKENYENHPYVINYNALLYALNDLLLELKAYLE